LLTVDVFSELFTEF